MKSVKTDNQESIHAACIQLCSGDSLDDNLFITEKLLKKAADSGATLTLLPENFSFLSSDSDKKMKNVQKQQNSPVLQFLADQAKLHQMWIVGGSLLLKSENDKKQRNSCPVLSPSGECVTIYDKMHLFDVSLPGEQYNESETVVAGAKPQTVTFDQWKIGLSICYDLRFPELYRHYSSIGCNVLTVPAAFTVPTGKAHWKTLLRARAIENQCYILASGQCGTHPGGRKTWGHSMIIDPWGEVLAELNDGQGVITAELSLNNLRRVGQAMPVLNHRRV